MNMHTYLISFLLFSSTAFAGHCKYLSVKHINAAFNELAQYKAQTSTPIVDYYCKSCNDTYVRPIVLEELEYKPHQIKGFASIFINGKQMDLAYLYLNGQNLGHKYNCKTDIASKVLFGSKDKD
ncbi:MAG: hypothetical protein KC478_02985 [Bacteriovoracaceae bacterium]|nr:hypothetical protein [Bacteriovoracaceae bacterium]